MWVRGRVPGILRPNFCVVEEKDKVVVTDSKNPDFELVVHLDQVTAESEESYYMLDEGEKEVRCSMQWKEDGKIVTHNGKTHVDRTGNMRCDTQTCLPFWLEGWKNVESPQE